MKSPASRFEQIARASASHIHVSCSRYFFVSLTLLSAVGQSEVRKPSNGFWPANSSGWLEQILSWSCGLQVAKWVGWRVIWIKSHGSADRPDIPGCIASIVEVPRRSARRKVLQARPSAQANELIAVFSSRRLQLKPELCTSAAVQVEMAWLAYPRRFIALPIFETSVTGILPLCLNMF